MTALCPAPVRQPRHVQSAEDRQAVYDYVTARDVTCRAPAIANMPLFLATFRACSDGLERHHAGNTIGSKRITDERHVVLLCKFHHANWAPSHSRLILEWLRTNA